MAKLLERYHKWRRETFPASKDDVAWRHDLVDSRLKSIEASLAFLSDKIVRGSEIVRGGEAWRRDSDLESRLNNIEGSIASLSDKMGFGGASRDLAFLRAMPPENIASLLNALEKSKSQLRQDIFVLSETSFKKNGFFVDFGATNGVDLSNSHLLETGYGWRGILAEPARRWRQELERNRGGGGNFIETACVWNESARTISFNETRIPELSTIASFSAGDMHASSRQHCNTYDVQTISLLDLLDKYNSPSFVDYLSIDTEGTEYDILKSFDFRRYEFGVITCEHNYTHLREMRYTSY